MIACLRRSNFIIYSPVNNKVWIKFSFAIEIVIMPIRLVLPEEQLFIVGR